MPGSVDVETLAMELRATRKAQSNTARLLKKHVDGCDASNVVAAKAQVEAAEKLEALAKSVSGLEDRFEVIDTIGHWVRFIGKYGKWLALTIGAALISAFTTLYVQAYSQHVDTVSKASVAAAQATQAAAASAHASAVIDQKLTAAPLH